MWPHCGQWSLIGTSRKENPGLVLASLTRALGPAADVILSGCGSKSRGQCQPPWLCLWLQALEPVPASQATAVALSPGAGAGLSGCGFNSQGRFFPSFGFQPQHRCQPLCGCKPRAGAQTTSRSRNAHLYAPGPVLASQAVAVALSAWTGSGLSGCVFGPQGWDCPSGFGFRPQGCYGPMWP